MTSATTEPASTHRRRHAKGHGLTIIAVDVVALYRLCAYGSRATLTA
jgi:hypothetical protein